MEPNELARVAFNGARMGGYLGGVFVVDDAQFERVGLVLANVVGGGVRVHWLAMRGEWSGLGWLWQVELVLIGKRHVTQSTPTLLQCTSNYTVCWQTCHMCRHL